MSLFSDPVPVTHPDEYDKLPPMEPQGQVPPSTTRKVEDVSDTFVDTTPEHVPDPAVKDRLMAKIAETPQEHMPAPLQAMYDRMHSGS